MGQSPDATAETGSGEWSPETATVRGADSGTSQDTSLTGEGLVITEAEGSGGKAARDTRFLV